MLARVLGESARPHSAVEHHEVLSIGRLQRLLVGVDLGVLDCGTAVDTDAVRCAVFRRRCAAVDLAGPQGWRLWERRRAGGRGARREALALKPSRTMPAMTAALALVPW